MIFPGSTLAAIRDARLIQTGIIAMTERPIGPVVTGFAAPPRAPDPDQIAGRHVVLERLNPDRHAEDLFAANRGQDWLLGLHALWSLPGSANLSRLAGSQAAGADPFFYAMRDGRTGRIGACPYSCASIRPMA